MVFSQIVAPRKLVRQRVKKYGLQSQRKTPYYKSNQLLQENGFVLTDRNKNCLFTNSGSETMKHWLVKAIIFKILRERRAQVGTEVEVNGGIVDVLDIDNMIAYEVEKHFTKRKLLEKLRNISGLRDVFFIDILEVPDDICEAESFIREKVV